MDLSRAALFTIFAFAIIGGAVIGFQDLDIRGGTEVVDCRNSSHSCGTSYIEKRVSECPNMWSTWKPYSEFNCSFTSKGVDEVSLVSDAANYVDRPRTEENYEVETLWQTGYEPWDLEFLPSGQPIWTGKRGRLRYVEDGQMEILTDIDVILNGENGLLGLAVDPDFKENNYIYLYYSFNISAQETLNPGGPIHQQRISRFRMVNGTLIDEKTLIEVPGSKYHAGGRLEFGPDGKLYVSTGEASMGYRAADPDFLGGKILRLNPDGSVPEDNPFNGSATYSMGHRNPQGLAWSPETGELYNTEHGSWRMDELNRVEPGANHGWPYYECGSEKRSPKDDDIASENLDSYDDYRKPVRCWSNFTMAPSGMTFVNDTESPWHGDLFVAGLRGNHLARFSFEGGEVAEYEVFYISDDESQVGLRMRDVEYRDGSLYVLANNRGMVRLTPQ